MTEAATEGALERAEGSVAVTLGRAGLVDLEQRGCLKLRFPRPAGTGPEAVLLNMAGGVLGGDRLDVSITLTGGAGLFTTASAEKIHRARPSDTPARVRNTVTVAAGAHAEWLPQETILFDGAALDRFLTVELSGDARFLGGEMLVFGRAARGEQIRRLQLRDGLRIRRDGRLLLQDAVRMNGDAASLLDRAAIGGGSRAIGTLVTTWPDGGAIVERLRTALEPCPLRAGVSAWNGLVVARFLAEDEATLRAGMATGLMVLRGDVPRLWSR